MRPASIRLLLLLGLLGGCSANVKPDFPEERESIVHTAMAQVGKPYHYAGADPDSGFDCSGLVYYSYGQAGVAVPRNTQSQMAHGEMISYENAQPGDLLFYRFEEKQKSPSGLHVVLYTGSGSGVHAPSSGRSVSTVRVNQPAWSRRYLGTVNLLARTATASPRPAATMPVPAAEPAPPPAEIAPEASDAITPPRAVEPAPAINTVTPLLLQENSPEALAPASNP